MVTQERARGSKARDGTEGLFPFELPTPTHQDSRSLHASKRSRDETPDDYLSSDIGHYDVPAEGRFLRRVGFGVLFGGIVVAIGMAVIDAINEMTTAFTSLSSLLKGAAWIQFLSRLGAFTKIGLLVLAGALLWRLLRRRKKLKAEGSGRLAG